MSAREPNPRFYRHVRIVSDDFTKPDAWEFYSVVKNWPEFIPGIVQKTEDERILNDVKLDSVILGERASLKAVMIWHARGIKFENFEYWLSCHLDQCDQVKHIMTLDEAIRGMLEESFELVEEVKAFVEGKSQTMDLEGCGESLETLDELAKGAMLQGSMEPHRAEFARLLQKWTTLEKYSESFQIKSYLEDLIRRVFG